MASVRETCYDLNNLFQLTKRRPEGRRKELEMSMKKLPF